MNLNDYTKDELIVWIKQQYKQPNEKFFLNLRWEKLQDEIEKRSLKSMARLQALDGKKQDELARQFNNETDLNKRLELINLMKPFTLELESIMKYDKETNKLRTKVEKIFKDIMSH